MLDTVIALREPPDYQQAEGARFAVHFEKARGFHGKAAEPFEAALGEAGWVMRDAVDAEVERALALRATGLSVREIAEEMGTHKSWVERRLRRADEAAVRSG